MPTLYIVRHGRAAAGWDTAVDPPLDEVGRDQARATATVLAHKMKTDSVPTLDVVSSPLRRCRETAEAFEREVKMTARVEPRIAEIPSPDGIEMADRVTWLRRVTQGTWRDLAEKEGVAYAEFHAHLVGWARSLSRDTVAFSHFVAINALIGAALGDDRLVIRSLDNASITVLQVDEHGVMTLVEGGSEADTLIR